MMRWLESGSRGDVAIVLALVVVSVLLLSSITVAMVLTTQLRSAGVVTSSERAIYAANTGLEEVLYRISRQFETDVALDGELVFPESGEVATYRGQGRVVDQALGKVCAYSVGVFRGQERRLFLGPPGCADEF